MIHTAIEWMLAKLEDLVTIPPPPNGMMYCPECGGTGFGKHWVACTRCGSTGYILKTGES